MTKRALFWTATFCLLVGAFGVAGCSDSNSGEKPDGGMNGGCDITATDTMSLEQAFADVKSNQTICIEPGTYTPSRQLGVASATGVTVMGTDPDREKVVLDFDGVSGKGIFITANDFTLKNVWIKNTSDNGVEAKNQKSHFDNIKVSWDRGPDTMNGRYGIYPTHCSETIVENSEVTDASDAGLYVGQCTKAIIRNNKVHTNVAGIEVENSVDADVYGNEVFDNAGGILALLESGLDLTKNENVLFRDNNVHDNNHVNFAHAGSTVSNVPSGTGIMVLGSNKVAIRGNTVKNNNTAGVLVVGANVFGLLDILTGSAPPPQTDIDPFSRNVYIHGNTWMDNGTSPDFLIKQLAAPNTTTADVLWGGILPYAPNADSDIGYGDLLTGAYADSSRFDPNDDQMFCLGDPASGSRTYMDLRIPCLNPQDILPTAPPPVTPVGIDCTTRIVTTPEPARTCATPPTVPEQTFDQSNG